MIITLVAFAFFFGILISRIGLPPMVGFLTAGFAYNFAGLEAPAELQPIADLGVTLLLFSIGNTKCAALQRGRASCIENRGSRGLRVPAEWLFLARCRGGWLGAGVRATFGGSALGRTDDDRHEKRVISST